MDTTFQLWSQFYTPRLPLLFCRHSFSGSCFHNFLVIMSFFFHAKIICANFHDNISTWSHFLIYILHTVSVNTSQHYLYQGFSWQHHLPISSIVFPWSCLKPVLFS